MRHCAGIKTSTCPVTHGDSENQSGGMKNPVRLPSRATDRPRKKISVNVGIWYIYDMK